MQSRVEVELGFRRDGSGNQRDGNMHEIFFLRTFWTVSSIPLNTYLLLLSRLAFFASGCV